MNSHTDMIDPDGPRILVLYAHPAPHRSRVNRAMAEAVEKLPFVELHDLYQTYPDFHFELEDEQTRLARADLIVLQHPVQWYSMPALLKEWMDVVLQSGWAYGPGGTKLQGKSFLLAATTGGTEDAYQPDGYHGYPFEAFLPSYEMTARLCGMHWTAPLVLHGAHRVSDKTVRDFIALYVERLTSFHAQPRRENIDG